MSKLPAIQFYPGDWRKDPGVQALSFHDRGVWFEILLLMHESDERGKLKLNGKPMPTEALGRLLGLDNQNLTTTITKLLEYGVASTCEESGALICRRMVRDEELREVRKKCGKMGGNPNLVNQKPTKQVKQKQTTKVKQSTTPSSSVSTSISSSEEEGEQAAVAAPPTDWQEQILEAFDETFGTSSRLTAARAKHLNARWKDRWWQENWQLALERGGESAFLRGANDRGWVIDFEFFLRPDTATKILEGKYDDRQQHSTKLTTNQQRENNTAAVFDRFRKAAAEATASGLIGGGSVSGRIDAAG